MVIYRGAKAILYVQETPSSQLDSVSNSPDTGKLSTGKNVEVTFNNKLNQYITCDGEVKYFEGPLDITFKAQQFFARGEMISAVLGQDSLAGGVYTVSKYSQFLPRLAMRLFLDEGASQYTNIRLINCLVNVATLRVEKRELVMNDVQGVAEDIGVTEWKGGQ